MRKKFRQGGNGKAGIWVMAAEELSRLTTDPEVCKKTQFIFSELIYFK